MTLGDMRRDGVAHAPMVYCGAVIVTTERSSTSSYTPTMFQSRRSARGCDAPSVYTLELRRGRIGASMIGARSQSRRPASLNWREALR
jgi:hypothetical protein